MGKTAYENRQQLEMSTWPELRQKFDEIVKIIMPVRLISAQLKWEVFTMSSFAGGCNHCQAHGAYGLNLLGTSLDRIRAIWDFEYTEEFNPAEKAALRFARDAAKVPNETEPEHFAEMREYYSDDEIVELLAVVAAAGWLNRWNDSIAVVTDQESVDWASKHLADLGWSGEKHKGADHEQRKAHPMSVGKLPKR